MTLPDAEERLYRFLCALQNQQGEIEKLPNMARLAPRLNMSRASLYRVLDKLIEDGKFDKGRYERYVYLYKELKEKEKNKYK